MTTPTDSGRSSASPDAVTGDGSVAERAPVGRMFAVLGLGEVVARLIGFAGTIYIARRLGAESYGIIAVASAVVLYFSQLANFSVELLGARELATAFSRSASAAIDRTQIAREVARIVPPLLLARLAIAVGCIALLTGFGLLFMPSPDGSVLALSAFSLLAVAASTRFVFVGMERPIVPAVATALGEVLALAVTLLFVHTAADVRVVPLSRIAGEGTAALLMIFALRRGGIALPPRRGAEVVRPLFAAAMPLVAHAILGLAIFNSDLIFLRALRDARTAGMYAAAYTLISFLLNLGVTYGTSILPALARERDDAPRQRAIYDQAMIQVLVVAIPMAVGGAMLAAGLLDLVFGTSFDEAVRPLQILMWSIVVAWIRNVVQMGLVARDQQAFVLRTTVWSAAANAALNVALIPAFGMVGAAAATLATETFRTVVALRFAQQLQLPFGVWGRLWRPVLGAAAMAALLWFAAFPHVLLAVAAGGAAYAAVLVASGGIRLVQGKLRVEL